MKFKDLIKNKVFEIISTEESLADIEPFFTDEELRKINEELSIQNKLVDETEKVE